MNKVVRSSFRMLAIILVLAIVGCKKKDVDLSKAFVKYYGGLKSDVGAEVLQTPDGGYIIAGTSNLGSSDIDNYNMIVIKTDVEGNEVWHKTFGGPYYDEGGSIAIVPDGYIILGTYGKTARAWDVEKLEVGKDSTIMMAVKIDLSGNLLWEEPYGYSSADTEVGTFGKSIVVNSDGTCFLGGMVDSTGPGDPVNLDLFAVMINQSNGKKIIIGGIPMKPLRYGADDIPDYMFGAINAFGTMGNEFLISSSTFLDGENTPRLVKCRMNGITLTQYNAPSKTDWTMSDGALSMITGAQICRTGDNNYMMTGAAGVSAALSNIYMFKLNGSSLVDNNPPFLKFFGGEGRDEGVSIIETSDGGYAILATTSSTTYTGAAEKLDDVLLLKLDNNGNEQWKQVFGGTGNDQASRLIQTSDGGYLICGTIAFGDDVSGSGASNSITLIKVNSEGEISNLK